MSNAPINVCLLGLGRAGNFHLQSLRLLDEARLTCVFDIDQNQARCVADRHGCHAANSAEEAVTRPDVDAVIVATPTGFHFEGVQLALEAKKPVLTEKPLGRTLQEVDQCFQRAEERDTPLFVAFQRRFDPAFASLVKAVRAGNIGQLQFVRSVSRDNPVPTPAYIRESGGIYHDCLVHDLDMLYHIVREIPSHMSAFGSSFIQEIGDLGDVDNVVACLTFPSGITASIDINRKSVYGYDQRIEAFGDGGMVQADNYHCTSVAQANDSGFSRPPINYSFPTRYRDAYLEELRCFTACARGDSDVPITHNDVRVNHLLANGLEVAAKEKRVVRFEEIESWGH